MVASELTNFDDIHSTEKMLWMGQNTNHLQAHPAVKEVLLKAVSDQSFNNYAPPQGYEELRELILRDVVGDSSPSDAKVLITDGAIDGLYLVCKRYGDAPTTLITSDPTWVWPLTFAKNQGANVRLLPIYDGLKNYKIQLSDLKEALRQSSNPILYLIDPLNPLGSSYTLDELKKIAEVLEETDALVIHDCTYRDFAFDHHLMREILPKKTITTYSFSKWLGIAGLRTGAIIADTPIFEFLLQDQSNILGSNVLGQQAAIAAFSVKEEWIDEVNTVQRGNQKMIAEALPMVEGLYPVVYPSNGNFLAVDCQSTGITASAIAAEFLKRGIFIRTSNYHSEALKDFFLKISTTVPVLWVEKFCEELPSVLSTCSVNVQK